MIYLFLVSFAGTVTGLKLWRWEHNRRAGLPWLLISLAGLAWWALSLV